jgi:hypothetical protein
MFVFVATGLAVMGGAMYSVLNRTEPGPAHRDRLSGMLLLVSAVLLLTALLVALTHLARG